MFMSTQSVCCACVSINHNSISILHSQIFGIDLLFLDVYVATTAKYIVFCGNISTHMALILIFFSQGD